MMDAIQYHWPYFDVWDFPDDEPVPHARIYARSRWGHEAWCSVIINVQGEPIEYYIN